jgi:hypothetical protein
MISGTRQGDEDSPAFARPVPHKESPPTRSLKGKTEKIKKKPSDFTGIPDFTKARTAA